MGLLTENMRALLAECKVSLEKEIKQKEEMMEDFEWELRCTKQRAEYCKKSLADLEAILAGDKIWTNDGEL